MIRFRAISGRIKLAVFFVAMLSLFSVPVIFGRKSFNTPNTYSILFNTKIAIESNIIANNVINHIDIREIIKQESHEDFEISFIDVSNDASAQELIRRDEIIPIVWCKDLRENDSIYDVVFIKKHVHGYQLECKKIRGLDFLDVISKSCSIQIVSRRE
jgi:hypothetical protein